MTKKPFSILIFYIEFNTLNSRVSNTVNFLYIQVQHLII